MSAPTPAERLADAERDAALARERMTATLATLQHRLNPRAFARDTIRDVGDRGSAVAQTSLDTARRNPGAIAGVAAGLGIFAIGRPVLRLLRRRRATPPPPVEQVPALVAPAPTPIAEGSMP